MEALVYKQTPCFTAVLGRLFLEVSFLDFFFPFFPFMYISNGSFFSWKIKLADLFNGNSFFFFLQREKIQ